MKFNKLDEIDMKLLELLSDNSRASYVELSKAVNLSRVAIKSRIESLEKKGVIEKYTIVLNLRKMGREVAAFFDIDVEPSKLYEIGVALAKKDYVTDVYQMTGTGNIHMHAMLQIDDGFSDFLEKELYSMDGVLKVTSRLILTRFKARKGTKL